VSLRLSVVAVVLAGALLSGCGNKREINTRGETEGVYLTVAGLKYQVQISRQLNPSATEDRAYLAGLLPADRSLPKDSVWFAVFIRVENDGEHGTHRSAEEFEIEDTVGKAYRPLRLVNNPFAYRAKALPPHSLIPVVDSVASESTIQGSLLLFKMPLTSLGNRPLELIIRPPGSPPRKGCSGSGVACVDLDV
jgi:hypothetical protein